LRSVPETRILSLILGMGFADNANYIVCIGPACARYREHRFGQQNGLDRPLIAVHLFLWFYYRHFMADVTPPVVLPALPPPPCPVGNPIKTGVVAFFYSLRLRRCHSVHLSTPKLLLIDVTWCRASLSSCRDHAMLLVRGSDPRVVYGRNRFYETIALLLIAFTRPARFPLGWIWSFPPLYRRGTSHAIVQAPTDTPLGEDLPSRVAYQWDLGDRDRLCRLVAIAKAPPGTAEASRLITPCRGR